MAKPYVWTPADEKWLQSMVEQVMGLPPGSLIVLPDDTEEEE